MYILKKNCGNHSMFHVTSAKRYLTVIRENYVIEMSRISGNAYSIIKTFGKFERVRRAVATILETLMSSRRLV